MDANDLELINNEFQRVWNRLEWLKSSVESLERELKRVKE